MISDDLRDLFDRPPREFGPTPLWWWSGAAVTPERLAWQMRKYDEGGIHNLVVINLAPAGPLFGAAADDPAWFSEQWWERFRQTCDIATERDMKIWFYDQIGFSGANIQGTITHHHPEAAGARLRSRTVDWQGDRLVLRPGEQLLGAYRAEDGRRIDASADGDVQARVGERLQVVTSVPTAFDYLSPHAVSLLIDTIHGEYERRVPEMLGTTIAGSFQDEAPGTNSWTSAFAAEFAERRGYDLLDRLPALFGREGGEAAKVRGDYYAVRTDLTEAAFFRPLGEWHARHGMLIGADQSNPARAGYPTQATQIYSDYFRTHRWYGALGSDHEGDAKIGSSMAHLYGHDRVWLEAFHSSGWGGTLEDTWDWLLPFIRSGANLYDPHATYFGTAGGWFEWAPPSTDWRQPYWEQYPAFSKAVARTMSMLSWGTFDAEVALLHPTATVQAAVPVDLPVDHFGSGVVPGDAFDEINEAQEHYLDLAGSNNWFRTRTGALDRARVAFDVIDDASLQREPVRDGVVSVGALHYGAVVLPGAVVLEEATAAALLALLESGGRVLVVGRLPRAAAGLAGDDALVQRLAAHPRLERFTDPDAAATALEPLSGHAVSDVPILVRRRDDEYVAFVTGAFPNASGPRRLPGSYDFLWHDNEFDPSLYAHRRPLRIRGRVSELTVLDPASGAEVPADIRVEGAESFVTFDTGGAPAVLVTWRESGTPVPPVPPVAPVAVVEQPVDGPWSARLVPTMDNTWGDLAMPLDEDTDRLQVWSMEWQEGPAESWRHSKTTYGSRVRVLGPVDAGSAPEALTPDQAADVLGGMALLAPGEWAVREFSTSRGIEKPGHGMLGGKGVVPEEFVRVPSTGDGQVAVVRAVVATDVRGPAELVVLAGAEKRVWWNGIEVGAATTNVLAVPVEVRTELNVLEYRLGADRNAGLLSDGPERHLGSAFTVTSPGGFGERPAFMTVGAAQPDGRVEYRRTFECESPATRARLVVGAAVGVTVQLDGAVVARQEAVEYYESEWGANPAYFSHDITAATTAGSHELVLVVDSAAASDVLYVDLVVESGGAPVVLTSGSGWEVETGGRLGTSTEHLGGWGELSPMHAAPRSHPLPGTTWLNAEPIVGVTPPRFAATDSAQPAPQRFRFVAAAGTAEIELPLALAATVQVDGRPVDLRAGVVTLPAPLERPGVVQIETEPTAVLRGGAAWTGPARLRVEEAQVPVADWRDVGLGAWSGGVRYRREVTVPAGAASAVLDLGRVRGSVRIEVDGEHRADLFCAPFRVDLGDREGAREVVVTVYNTLAPFLYEATPTGFVFPSQMESGLLGPVVLRTS